LTSNCGYAALLRVNASVGAVSEAGLCHAAYAAYNAWLTYARDHLATRETRLECDIRCAIVAVGIEVDAVLRAFFGIVCAETEKLCVAGDGGCSIGIDHAAHTAIHAAFHDDDAAGDADAAIAIDAVRVACADVNVVVTAGDLEVASATATGAKTTATETAWTAATRVAAG